MSQDRYFTRDQVQLRYRDEGQGPAVLWLHGWTLDLQMWEPQVEALRDTFRLICLDRRGFGLSGGEPSLGQDVQDVWALCEALGLARVALVGMSQGARVAIACAQARPDSVSCVVLDGPPNFASARSEVPLAHFRELVRTRGMEEFRREWRAHSLTRLRSPDQRLHALLEAMITRYPGADLRRGAPALPLVAGPDLDSLRTPVLIIYGDHESRARAAAARALVERLPCAEQRVIPSSGHMPNLDNPSDYNAAVREFLARHAAR